MKSKFLLIVFLLFFIQLNLGALNIDLGVKIPANLGLDLTGGAGVWPGLILGGGFTAKIGLLDNLVMPNSKFALEAFGMFSFDQYFLPSDKYAAGSYIDSFNIRYGGNILFYFTKNLYAGLGATLVYTFAGNYGTPTLNTNFSTTMLGNDFYISAVGGFEFELIKNQLFLPVELKISMNPFISNTFVMEVGLNIACVYRFNFDFKKGKNVEPPKPVQTNAIQPPVKEPMVKKSAAEIQKLSVPEIVSEAKKAVAGNEIDYAKLLVKEGLLKEPDNGELLSLFNELMKR